MIVRPHRYQPAGAGFGVVECRCLQAPGRDGQGNRRQPNTFRAHTSCMLRARALQWPTRVWVLRVCVKVHTSSTHAGATGRARMRVVGAPAAAGMHACDTASTMHGMPRLTRCACMQPMRVRGCVGVATVRCAARHPCTHTHHTAPGSAHVLDACWLQTGAADEVGSAGRRRGGAAPSPRRAPPRTLCTPQPAPMIIDATTP